MLAMSARHFNVFGCLLLVGLMTADASAQSTSATLWGAIVDEQRAVLVDATVTLTNLDTGAVRTTTSDAVGTFHLTGLAPGQYELRITRSAFAPTIQRPIVLTVGEEARNDAMLRLASVNQEVTVSEARVAGIEPTKTVLGRTFTQREIDALPVPGRDFTTLATLTPGVLPDLNQGGGSNPNLTGFATAGQNGRNNAILIDGLSHDDALPGAMRGIVSLEAVQEFVVATNGFAAEYGQASGALVNVVTRSGTNAFSTRAFYLHRDDDWDATPGSAKLAVPPAGKTRLDQRIIGGSAGGPLVRNRAFFFGSIEHFVRDTDFIVTSPVLQVFHPGQDPRLPQHNRNPNLLGRVDSNLAPTNRLTVRYRLDDSTSTNRFTEADLRLGIGERAHDLIRRDQDLGIIDTHVFGSNGVNELRALFGRRFVDLNVDAHCGINCLTEDRPSIRLGKSFNLPQKRTEDRWQLVDTFTRLVSNRTGQHMMKTGVDVSFIHDANFFPLNFAGTFTFNTDLPFNRDDPATYPTKFTQGAGSPNVDIDDNMYAVFLQDQWRPLSRLTINGGLRWDYEDGPGISQDHNNVAPRLGVSYDLTGASKTIVRASYGHYYDQVPLQVARDVEQAGGVSQIAISNPGYRDPFGPNLLRKPSQPTLPSQTRYGNNNETPLAAEGTVGIQQQFGAKTVLAVDGIWARGWHLLEAHDQNYPNLNVPGLPRPDPNYQIITAYETRGNSWYSGLQASLRRQHANRYSYYVAYTVSKSERDTEDFRFMPQDQRDFAADRGPGANDSRHRLAANAAVDLPYAFQIAGILTTRSALPYNITTGFDDNQDTFTTDRPPGVRRNSGRGDPFWQTDVRISRAFRLKRTRIELLGEIFNLANHRNWIGINGNKRSAAQFGKPTAAAGAREIQLGVRVEY
jgi:carboxypeptidase family protein/TonB-dependent receptor-like protein